MIRNVADKLPDRLASTVAKRMRVAYQADLALAAEAQLGALARELDRIQPGGERRLLRTAVDADESAVVVVERTVDGYAAHDKARHLTTTRGAQSLSRHAQQVSISAGVVDLIGSCC
jgi:hypothetical protein